MSSEETPAAGDPYRAGIESSELMIVTTTNEVAGYRIDRYLAIVRGLVFRTTGIGQGFKGAFRALGGGNIKEFAANCEAARHEAHRLMIEHATELGADAVIGMRYDANGDEVLAYGTAVRLVALPPLLPSA
ncbi:MAG TPA: YbjQ family protein [Kofleriaceae bacterium]